MTTRDTGVGLKKRTANPMPNRFHRTCGVRKVRFTCRMFGLFRMPVPAVLVFVVGAMNALASSSTTIELWGLVESNSLVGTFAAIREFERRNPGTRVLVGTPGGQGDLDPQKLITALVSHTPPDVIWFGRHNMGLWAPRKAFRCLDDLIAREGIDLSQYYPGALGEAQWEGKTYALPWNVDCRVLFCNMEILRRHGIERPPRTWEELERTAVALTSFDETRNRYNLLGFAPNYGNSWLFLYGWQLGAKWISDNGRRALLNASEVREALEWMVHMTDAVGGAERVAAFQSSAQLEGIGDPFLSNRIAMQINGSYILDYIARLRPDMDFAVVPPPTPHAGDRPLSWSGGFSWVIPTEAKHPEAAWQFITWMNSEEAWIVQTEAQRQLGEKETGKNALFVPLYHANRVINERLFQRYMTNAPARFREADRVCLDLLPFCKYRPVTPASGELWDAQAEAIADATFHVRSPAATLELQQRRVQSALDRFFRPPRGKVLSNREIVRAIAALIAAGALVLIAAVTRALRRVHGLERRRALHGMLFISPWAFGFLFLVLGPMLYSLIMAFTRYNVLDPPEWTGFENWVRMFGFHGTPAGWTPNDPKFWKGLWNTLYITVFGVPFGMVVSLVIALFLNAKIRGMNFYRTLYYVPVMVPAVAAAFIWIWLLNPETGFVNYLLGPLFHSFGLHAPSWFVDARWAKPGMILLLTWGCGGTVIIWLAGLQTMPRHLYEAAMIDGAGPWSRFLHITLPLMTPYALFILIMGTIGSLQVFTQAYMIGAPGDALLFYVLYLFFAAFRYLEMGYACAMAWVLFVVTVVICLLQIRLSRKYVHYETEGI